MASSRRSLKNHPKLKPHDPQTLTLTLTPVEVSIPNHFRCPISLDLMSDPVTVSTGITYDRASIETWLDAGNSKCPVTNQELVADDLIPNHSLRRLIQDWCVANSSLGIERIPTPTIPITTAHASQILAEISGSGRTGELALKIGQLVRDCRRNQSGFAEAGAAKILAELFSSSSSTSDDKISILSSITCFLPLDREACRYLSSRDSLKSLSSIMKHGDLPSRLKAVTVIKELAAFSKETARLMASDETDGLNEGLVEIIGTYLLSPRVTKKTLATIYILISSDHTNAAMRFVELGLVPLVLDVLVGSVDKAMCEKALAVFDEMLSSERGREAARGHALSVPVLVKKMFRVSDYSTELVVSALWKMCKKSCGGEEEVVVEAIQVGAFQKVLLLLQVSCSGGVKEKATELLKVMNGSKEKLDCVDIMDFKGLNRSF